MQPVLLRVLTAVLVVPLALVAGGCFMVIGNGDVVVDERALVGFDAVVNASALSVEIARGEADAVRVVCDSNLLDRVETSVDDGVLRIGTAGLASLHARGDCRVEVEAERLRAVDNAGSGALAVFGEAPELGRIHQRGSGAIEVEELTAATVDARLTGSGSVRLIGHADDVSLVSTGSGRILARELQAATVHARSTGSGGIELHAGELVDAELVGSGDIQVWGAPPDRRAHRTGSGQIVFH